MKHCHKYMTSGHVHCCCGRALLHVNPNPVIEKANTAQCEAEARFAPDRCPHSCENTNPKEVGHLVRTARKKQSRRCSSQLCKTRIRNPFTTDGTDMISTQNSNQYWLDKRESDALGSDDHTYHVKKVERERYKQICVLENEDRWLHSSKQDFLPFLVPSSNPRAT